MLGSVKSKSARFSRKNEKYNVTKYLELKPRSVNQLEQRRALRQIQELHKTLKVPVPHLSAVLSYLKWLDKMDSWTGKQGSLSINQGSPLQNDMYSWSGNFGNPIALPKIKKYPDSEKFSSRQLKESMYEKNSVKIRKYRSLSAKEFSTTIDGAGTKAKATLQNYYNPEGRGISSWQKPSVNSSKKVRFNGKPTPFYIHAIEGFQYWPKEIYRPPEHPSRYSFGERFNPGRAGVIIDRIYAKPRTNKHYWTEFQTRQNPIGSGNTVTGNVLKN